MGRILAALNIKSLNDMQEASLKACEDHRDVVLLSATGSGKTLAFLLPLLPLLDSSKRTTQALIVVPSRELALQIEEVFRKMKTGLKVTCCYGGHLRETEENNLVEPPALIIGTPGRLCDHIRRGNITVDTIETLVLDEFDKSLELGFVEEVSFIVSALPALQRRMLTSATKAVDIPDFIGLEEEPAYLNFLPEDAEAGPRLDIRMLASPDKDKADTLFRLLCMLGNRPSIIFCNHRDAVERVSAILTEKGIANEFYHGAMDQRERESALFKLRSGGVDFLVTTDLAARGLDIPFIRYIIHYHLPLSEEVFTHRNGRTARMEASGTAILLIGPEESLPAYVGEAEPITLPDTQVLPSRPDWTPFFIAAGKKDKVNKVDIVGFLAAKAQLRKEDIGLIEVKDYFSFVAVRRSKASSTLHMVKGEKIKNKKVRIDIAK